MGEYLPALRLKSLSAFLFYEEAKMKRISVAHRFKDMALAAARMHGIVFQRGYSQDLLAILSNCILIWQTAVR